MFTKKSIEYSFCNFMFLYNMFYKLKFFKCRIMICFPGYRAQIKNMPSMARFHTEDPF